MLGKSALALLVLVLAGAAVFAYLRMVDRKAHADAVVRAYANPAPAVTAPLNVFHMGHSLVGQNIPAMLAQLAGAGHSYATQSGWGTSLKTHWEAEGPVEGHETENHPDHYRFAREALGAGTFDALVLTEMVELRDAIRYHDSAKYLKKWVTLAREGNPDIRLYLYESWHRLDHPDGWLDRLDADLPALWETKVLLPSIGPDTVAHPIYVIPAGQAMAHFVRKVGAAGGIGEVGRREDLFARHPDGSLDTIHINDLGAYLVALTHYAVIYQASPVGLPAQLMRADGTPANAPSEAVARAMQESVWAAVTGYPKTGVRR